MHSLSAHTYTLLSHNMDYRPLARWHGPGDSLLPMRAVVHAELTEGVPCMLDMIGVQYAFGRRLREDLVQCALTSR